MQAHVDILTAHSDLRLPFNKRHLTGPIPAGEVGRSALTGVVGGTGPHTQRVGGTLLQGQLAVVYIQYIESMLWIIRPVGPMLRRLQTVLQNAIGIVGNAVVGTPAGLLGLLPHNQVITPW